MKTIKRVVGSERIVIRALEREGKQVINLGVLGLRQEDPERGREERRA